MAAAIHLLTLLQEIPFLPKYTDLVFFERYS